MAAIDATSEFVSLDLLDLTTGLYRFMLAAEPTLLARRPCGQEALLRLQEQARLVSQRFGDACARAGARFEEARGRASAQYEEACDRASEQLEEARSRFEEARGRAGARAVELIAETSANLTALVAELEAMRPSQPQMRQMWHCLGRNYEALRVFARTDRRRFTCPQLTLGHIKPRNLTRNGFHVLMGMLGVTVYELLLDRTGCLVVCGALLAAFLLTDLFRRVFGRYNDLLVHQVFGRFSRPGEAYQVPASTWYLAALLLGVAAFPQRAIQLGVTILALADPLASLAGKRWGRRKLHGAKSWAGSTAFFFAALAISAFFLFAWPAGLPPWQRVVTGAAVALAATLTELYSGRIDDNFSIPLVAGGVAALLVA